MNRMVLKVRNMKKILISFFICLGMADYSYAVTKSVRLKDVVNVKGVRSNQLIGYGIVVGLAGTGDSSGSVSTNESVANMLKKLGIHASAESLVSGNTAAVVASVELPAFARSGEKVDIRISAIGGAKSLAGGTLLLTPLRAGDGQVYVVGQGPVVVGQATGSGTGVLTVATIPQGGIVEREFTPALAMDGFLDLNLKKSDFTTNSRIADVINKEFKGFYAQSIDPVTVRIEVPRSYIGRIVEFVAKMESLKVDVDQKAQVVINERTGTVVMGSDVAIGAVSIAHGDLTISVDGKKSKEKSLMNVKGATVGELISSLNALGVKPKDLIGIIQAMHSAGAIQAELKFL